MNRESYEKQLIKQKIEANRDIARLELQSLRANNPVASAFSLGASVTSLLGGRGGTLLKSTSVASIPAVIFALVRLWRRRAAARSRIRGPKPPRRLTPPPKNLALLGKLARKTVYRNGRGPAANGSGGTPAIAMLRILPITLVLLGAFAATLPAYAEPPPLRVDLEFAARELTGGPGKVVLPVELAGHALSQFPYFEYVRSFHANEAIQLALDPGRAPELAGRTCDVYVVAARSSEQWTDDANLVDARAGGASTHTFSGGTIQSYTIPLALPSELSGDAGPGLGVGYDAVLDCDRDGRLGGGDFIDGAGDTTGLWVVRDTTSLGPLAVSAVDYGVGSVFGIPATHRRQLTYYPTNIANMGALPLAVIGHGNGHDYTWYDYLGFHLASYGYVVMSHQNDTCPGVENASSTTLGHTDAILDQQDTIAGGVLSGHIDGGRIIWIGHSRGGEGILRAYDRIYDGHYTPVHFAIDDLILLAGMAPTDFEGPAGTNPHHAPFHLLTGSGDDDVAGGPEVDRAKPFQIFERATGFRQSTVIQGAGHGDFHGGDPDSVYDGPCHLTPRTDVHAIIKGYFLPLVEYYARRNPAAKDFLWRQYEAFRPPGAPAGPCAQVNHEFRQPASASSFVIDDYDTEPLLERSSSGGHVGFSVANVNEGRMRDLDSTFDWNPADPMNGMTRARSSEPWSGVVFDWSSPASYEYEIVSSRRDWTAYDYVSLRACQQTRHPETTAQLGDLTFSIALRDAQGESSSIEIGTYGGGVEEPSQRDGGWANEFETLRLRLRDFTGDGNALDLSDIVALTLEFGGSAGSSRGRIGLDSVEVTSDDKAPLPGRLRFSIPQGVPDELIPGAPTLVRVAVTARGESVVLGTLRLYYRYSGGEFVGLSLDAVAGGLYEARLPPANCGDLPEFYFGGVGDESGPVTLPAGGAAAPFRAVVARHVNAFHDDFETDTGWSTEVLPGATAGQWERGVPVDATDWIFDPIADADGSGRCYLTQNETGNTDVDGGAVRLTSPVLDLSHPEVELAYQYFLRLTEEDGADALVVEAEPGDGNWTEIARHAVDGGLSWRRFKTDRAALVDAGLTPTSTTRVRFTVGDFALSSIVEAGVDAFEVYHLECP